MRQERIFGLALDTKDARDAAQRLAADGYRVVIRYPGEEIVGLRER